MRRIGLFVVSAAALVAMAVRAQTPPAQTAYRLRQIAPGIYSGFGTGTVNAGSNAAVIVNDDDVLVVDAHMTPDAARVLMKEIKGVTDKPVRFVVNTHFHYDHTNGNQVFAPLADIIGHEYTRRRLTGDILERGMFAELLAQQRDRQTPLAQQLREVKPTAPSVTVDDRMTLYRGSREIRLLYLGRGHTAGDLVVFLPKERVLCSGDLLVNGVANLVDGFVNEWPDALEKLRPLDFVDVIPGHGEPFKGKDRIDWFQAYLRDFWRQASALHDAKVSAADAAKRMDMTAHAAHYPAITGPGVNITGVARVYAVLEGHAD